MRLTCASADKRPNLVLPRIVCGHVVLSSDTGIGFDRDPQDDWSHLDYLPNQQPTSRPGVGDPVGGWVNRRRRSSTFGGGSFVRLGGRGGREVTTQPRQARRSHARAAG